MYQLLERDPIQSQSAVTAAYDGDRRTIDVEYFNGLVFRFFEIPPDIGTELFQDSRFDEVFQSMVAKRRDYKLVDKPSSMVLRWLRSTILARRQRRNGRNCVAK